MWSQFFILLICGICHVSSVRCTVATIRRIYITNSAADEQVHYPSYKLAALR